MGWWSKDIMGGDAPYDWEDEIYEICGAEMWPEGRTSKGKISPDQFTEHLEKIIVALRKSKDPIGYQVLGVLMMESGADMPEEVKSKIMQACHDDEWARRDPEREEKILELHDKVLKYDGTTVEIKSKGLFQAIAEHVSAGKTGLVNVVPPSE